MTENIQYIGEHLYVGIIGHICILLGFTSILFTIFSYYKSNKALSGQLEHSWKKLARVGFTIHGIAIFTLIGLLFYAMISQMFEYAYVQQHVSSDLPMRYIFSAFWEGQEGSFLLWMFWHIILGSVLIMKSKEWEAPVLLFFCLIQAVINSMLLGLHLEIGDFIYKFGSNPTLLLRDTIEAPIFQRADYLEAIKGTGLNPLLQNYWNTIHPPVTFLGFASLTVPYAFAAAGFYTGKYREWLTPVLPWALFSGGILGTGILMGSAWAYEALSFGGYWAWDPVENMSLVPWIILVAGIHTNLVSKSTGRAIKSTFIYYTMAFVLILYSTYLTRSGVLGDTSVHAFTEMGLTPQLVSMVLFFAFLCFGILVWNSKKVPTHKVEESIYSREFWMFIGALVLLFSGILIASSTSLPVVNKIISLFDEDFTGTVIQEPIAHFNKFQLWVAIFVTVLSAMSIFLRYKTKDWSKNQFISFGKKHAIHFLASLVFTYLLSFWIDYFHWKYMLLAFCGFFSIISNASYLISVAKFNPKMAASISSHIGFAVMIVGIITSGLNEGVVTENNFVVKDLIKDKDLASTVPLIKNEPFIVNDYWITYEGDTTIDRTRTFKIKFLEDQNKFPDPDSFYVYPNVLYNKDYTKVAASNPDAKHYVDRDIFTSVASLPKAQMDIKFAKEEEDSLKYIKYDLSVGDTLFTKEHYGVVDYITYDPQNKEYSTHENDLGIGVGITFRDLDKTFETTIEPAIGVKESMLMQFPEQINDLKVKLRLHEDSFDNHFSTEEKLSYETFKIKQGQTFVFNNRKYEYRNYDKNIENKIYKPLPADLALQANLIDIESGYIHKPVYLIREGKPYNFKDYDVTTGIHSRLVKIDPSSEEFIFTMAVDDRTNKDVSIEIAEDVTRSDVIILEAKVFPGINIFWLGAILMLSGFFIGMSQRRKKNV